MNRLFCVFLFACCFLSAVGLQAQRVFDIDLKDGAVSASGGDEENRFSFARCFLPDSLLATGKAVVALPGGGYGGLVFRQGGYDWAPFFNERGIAYIVLHYQLPAGKAERPVNEVKRTFELVRTHASDWNINPENVGIMGFSAGGHLAALAATRPELGICPDFQILLYPVITMEESYTDIGSRQRLLGDSPSAATVEQYSCEKNVPSGTPPAIILLSSADGVVSPMNAILYYQALLERHVEVTLHAFPSAWHGWGAKDNYPYVGIALACLSDWLGRL